MTHLSGNSSNTAATAGENDRGRSFWRPLLIVLVLEAVAVIAFYGFEWSWLRRLHVLWLETAVRALGCSVQAGMHCLTVNGRVFQISRDCTYVDLIICGLPLIWRSRRRWSMNLAWMAGYAGAVVAVNLLRVLYGVYWYANGRSLFWAHDLVDYVLWYPTMSVLAILWLRNRIRSCHASSSAASPQPALRNLPSDATAEVAT